MDADMLIKAFGIRIPVSKLLKLLTDVLKVSKVYGMASKLDNIIVHCSDSTWGSASEIRRWHLENGWNDVGYHFVILNGLIRPGFKVETQDGAVETGRFLDSDGVISDNEVGAHALGYNNKSIGICLIGRKYFTAKQIGSLIKLLHELSCHFGIKAENILGHYETERAYGKLCPNIEMNHVRYMIRKIKML